MTTRIRRAARLIGLILLGLLMLCIAGWGVLALLYWDHANSALCTGLAIAYGTASILALVGLVQRRWRTRAVGAFFALFALLLVCWFNLEPSNERAWTPDNAVLAYATIDGDRVTLHNIRNFDYRSENDYTPAYYDRTFNLSELDSVDLATVYWMGPAIAHVFVSFGFADGHHVAISIEARKEKGEGYSTVQGFFRQYELLYVVADERDVIRLRTNYRHDPPEEVYLYRVPSTAENRRSFFLEYLRKINELKEHAEWYNSLTTNCTSNIWVHTRIIAGHLPYSWKILVSGYVPEYLYEHGKLDTSVPLEELQRRGHVNERAHAADQAEDFSQRIRAAETPR
jgi:Domain of unknown function (DUF4105)/Glycosyltransferase family 87